MILVSNEQLIERRDYLTDYSVVQTPGGPLTSNPTHRQRENPIQTTQVQTRNDISPDQSNVVNPDVARPEFNPFDEITALTSLECVDPEIKDFDQHCALLQSYFKVTKVAQGSFAGVYRMELITSPSLYTVWKLIPIKPKKGRGSRSRNNQTLIQDAAAEVKALAVMQQIPGFVDFRSAQVLQGPLPAFFDKLDYDWYCDHSDDASSISYKPNQLWLLIEMSDAGSDLETVLEKGFPDGSLLNKRDQGQRLTIKQTWDIFWGVTEALARGEATAQFEHRDLHPGNICITSSKTLSGGADQHEIERFTNLQITLIDYTLSRAAVNETEVLANSMQDRALFEQYGENRADARQFDIYRIMRTFVVWPTAMTQQVEEKWKQFVPVTNVCWLYHILLLLLEQTEYYTPESQGVGEEKVFKDKKERKLAKALAELVLHLIPGHRHVWQYLSATEVVDDQMGRLETPLAAVKEGDSEAMGRRRKHRAELIEHEALMKDIRRLQL